MDMPNIASVLKAEITRLARKEVRAATDSLKKAAVSHRSEIAALKRRADQLERELKRTRREGGGARAEARPGVDAAPGTPMRFSAKGLAAQRRRLGLSASEVGLLLGASGQSVYNWEAGAARPRAKHMPAIAAMRKLGRRQATAILERLREKG